MEEKITFNIQEAAEIMGISKSLAYRLASNGEIPCMKLGNRILIPKARLYEFIQKQTI